VLVATAVLHGCTGRPVDVGTAPAAGQSGVRPGRAGFVVAAPHATSDASTDEMATEIARRTGFGLVIASGVSVEEGAVREAAQGPLRFYAEIHGNRREPCAGRIEIATVGIDPELAVRLRTLAELIRDAHLRGSRDVQRLEVLVEPIDRVTPRAAGASRAGILRLPQRGLLIELPRCARQDWRDAYTSILADFLAQAVTLPAGR
jgi:hypothetical protein